MMARVAVGGFQHETNTFTPEPTTFDTFVAADGWPGLTEGDALFDALRGYNIGISGLLEGAVAEGWEVVPLAWCGAGAGGTVTEDAYERCSEILLNRLAAALPLDGLLLDLHGAMTAEHLPDGEAEFLRRARDITGNDLPIYCSLDLHANLSRDMLELADQLFICRTYPHLDMAETGRRAARALAFELARDAGQNRPRHRRLVRIPFLIPITRGCTLTEPAASVYQALAQLEARAGIDHLSFACGFSAADVAHCGPAIVGYGTEPAAVDEAVDALRALVLDRESQFASQLWAVDEAVAHAVERSAEGPGARSGKPVILADVDDNAGAGEPSDTTWLLHELLRQRATGALLGVLWDEAAAREAHQSGQGSNVRLSLGASNRGHGQAPVVRDFHVEALSDGRFQTTGEYFAGGRMDLGPMALLSCDGVRVVVSSRREQAADQAMFTHLGADPAGATILVLKSSVHYRADFQGIAADILEVGAPGRPGGGAYRYENLREGVRAVPEAG